MSDFVVLVIVVLVCKLLSIVWRNTHLCTPPVLCNTCLMMYCTTKGVYRNGSSVYICSWVCRGILCKQKCYTAIITIVREGNVFRSVSVILFSGVATLLGGAYVA